MLKISNPPETSQIVITLDNLVGYMYDFCGHEENYNGNDNKYIDYMCSKCTQRLSMLTEYRAMAKELAARQRAMKRTGVRIRRGKRENRTLSTCDLKGR